MTKALPLAALLVLAGATGAAGQGGSSGPSFRRATAYPTGHGAAATAVGDLNGDRRPDLVSANAMRRTVSVLINKGNGRFRTKREFGTGRNPKSVAIGDLDGDGSGDIAAVNDAGTLSVLLGNGDGSFRGKRDYATGRGSQSIAIGDVNGDRKLDVVTANQSAGAAISVLLNRGDGSFQPRSDFGPDLPAVALVIGDLNGDGSLDLVTDGETVDGYIIWTFFNAGDGSFPTRLDYRAPFGPSSIEIGDVNGDGKPDLVWTHSEKETGPLVYVQLNRGRGGFFRGTSYSLHGDWATGGTSVAIADFNADRKADLAVTSRLHALSVLVNRGAGVFRTQLDYGIANYAGFVLADDLNGDRKPDLVVNGGAVSVLLNKPGLCDVQDLRRQTLLEAKRTLARVNCRVGKVSYAYSRTVRGLVIRQKPKLGTVLPGGARVDLVLSKGGRPT
jgi:large repetitive protein